jgi:hypothetical protein
MLCFYFLKNFKAKMGGIFKKRKFIANQNPVKQLLKARKSGRVWKNSF